MFSLLVRMERGEGRERRVEREVPLPHVAHVNKSSSKLPSGQISTTLIVWWSKISGFGV
jgi:hypothetical protein